VNFQRRKESNALQNPNTEGAKVAFKNRYDNFIGGEFVAPPTARTSRTPVPSTARPSPRCPVQHKDIERALDAAHKAKDSWGRTSPAERANLLNKIADRMEANWRCSPSRRPGRTASRSARPLPPTSPRHRPLPYFRRLHPGAGGRISPIDDTTFAYHFHEPLGVVGQIIPGTSRS
jgi:aldehyde dehydrogenase